MRVASVLFAALVSLLAAGAARAEDGPWFGASVETVTPAMKVEKGLAFGHGARVTAVEPESPAAEAGLVEGDVILGVNDAPVMDAPAFEAAVAKLAAGTEVKLDRMRGKEAAAVTVTLAARPAVSEPLTAGAPPRLMLDTGGHMAKISDLSFTPDGNFIVSASDDKTIRVWDWRTGKTVRAIRGESGPGSEGKIYALAISPDGARLAVAGFLAPGGGVRDDEVGIIRLYDFTTGHLVSLLKGHADVVNTLAFSPDGRRLVSAGSDHSALVWEVPTAPGEQPRILRQLIGHEGQIYAAAFTPDGQRVVTGSLDRTLRLWNLADGGGEETPKSVVLKGHANMVARVAVSLKDGVIASGGWDGEIRLWDGKSGNFLRVLGKQPAWVGALAFSPDGTRLVSTCGGGPPCAAEPQIVWDVPTGKRLREVKHHDNIVVAAAISPDGKMAITSDFNGKIALWDLATGMRVGKSGEPPLLLAGTGSPGWATGVSQDSRWIAWGSTNSNPGGMTPFNDRGPLEFALRLPAEGEALEPPISLGASGDAETPGARQDGAEAPEAAAPAPPPQGQTRSPADRSPGKQAKPSVGDFLRAESAHVPYQLWANIGGEYGYEAILSIVEDGNVVASLERGATNGYSHRSFAFTQDGATIVSGGGNGTLQAFDVAAVLAAAKNAPGHVLKDNDLARVARDFVGHESDVWAVTPSPDGKYLVSASADQTTRLWNLKTQELIVTLFHGRDGEWAMWTEQGYYTGSPGAGALVGWQINKGIDKAADYVRGVQLRKTLLRPDIVERAITLASARAAVKEAGLENVSIETLATRQPPLITLSASSEAAGGRANVIVESEPNPLPVTSVAIFVSDGKQETKVEARTIPLPPGTPTPEKGAIRRAYEVPLFKGQNTVRIVATNAGGESEPREVKIKHNGEGALDKRGTLWVLAIGVNEYPGAQTITDPATHKVYRYKRLTYAGADAQAFAETAVAGMTARHTKVDAKVLVNGGKDGEPTRANIVAALERIRAGSADTDTVLILLAGHGENWEGGRYHFLPTDLKRSVTTDIGENVLDWTTNIQPAITGAKGRKLLFLDACHSGNAYNRTLLASADADRYVAFSAAGPGEEALEFKDAKHGAFTYMLMEALKGADAALDPLEKGVTVYKLGDYVNLKVREKTFGKQTPEFRSGQGNFVLTRK